MKRSRYVRKESGVKRMSNNEMYTMAEELRHEEDLLNEEDLWEEDDVYPKITYSEGESEEDMFLHMVRCLTSIEYTTQMIRDNAVYFKRIENKMTMINISILVSQVALMITNILLHIF